MSDELIIPPDAWKWVLRDGSPIIKVCCPACGVWGELDHIVHEDGRVDPSLQCSNDGAIHEVVTGSIDNMPRVQHLGDRTTPCQFHARVQLAGWKWGTFRA